MVEGAPKFIHEFSKETDQEGRNETAKIILEKRAEGRKRSEEGQLVMERTIKLQTDLQAINTGWISRLKNRCEIKKIENELKDLDENSGDSLPEKTDESEDEFDEAKNILNGYYKKQMDVWRESGYEKADVEKYFTEENLERLDLDEYALLLSRFPSEMATHVTRQGIRDHTGMTEHVAGLGEHVDGAKNLFQDGRLRSAVGKFLASEKQDEALGEYFKWLVEQYRIHCPWVKESDRKTIRDEIDKLKIGAEAILKGESKSNHRSPGLFGDNSALHLGREVVLNNYYGGETGNEIFFAYPVGHFFAEHQFGDAGTHGIDENNDMWLWSKEHKGLSINAGLVFLPSKTMVDSKTGSKYFIDSEEKPVVDENRINSLTQCLQNPELVAYLREFYNLYDSKKEDRFYLKGQLAVDLRSKFNIEDRKIIGAIEASIYNYNFKQYLIGGETDSDEKGNKEWAVTLLVNTSSYYKGAENTIPAKEYWENYFSKNPHLRPSKIVYYEGTPTQALKDWLYKNKVSSFDYKKTRYMDTFQDEYASDEYEEESMQDAYYRYQEYIDLCERVLEKYFPEEDMAAQ